MSQDDFYQGGLYGCLSGIVTGVVATAFITGALTLDVKCNSLKKSEQQTFSQQSLKQTEQSKVVKEAVEK